jgi:prepilin-type N-terminal cleavage/methylation domain-containing protein
MNRTRRAFTLLEMLISITLFVILALSIYGGINMMKDTNAQLKESTKRISSSSDAVFLLYSDALGSDGNVTIKKNGKFSQLCFSDTHNSLYGATKTKVCWVVTRNDDLVRIEGVDNFENILQSTNIKADKSLQHVKLFDCYQNNSGLLVILKYDKEETLSFVIHSATPPLSSSKTHTKDGQEHSGDDDTDDKTDE